MTSSLMKASQTIPPLNEFLPDKTLIIYSILDYQQIIGKDKIQHNTKNTT